jgi:hypothetical protein
MIPEPISCPYCNSRVTPPGTPEPGQRIPCPRCGEQFPFHPARSEDRGSITAEETPQAPQAGLTDPRSSILDPRSSPSTPGRWSNRTIAAVLLGGMAAMALLGLVFALMTQTVRREHDFHLPKPEAISVPLVLRLGLGVYIVVLIFTCVRTLTRRAPGPAPDGLAPAPPRRLSMASIAVFALIGLVLVVMVLLTGRDHPLKPGTGPSSDLVRVVRPAELEGLGYLPANTNVVLGFHAAEAMQAKGARQYLGAFDLTALFDLATLEELTGLKLEDLDHLAAGLSWAKNLAQVTVVMQTRRPYDLKRVEKGKRPVRQSEYGQKPAYFFAWDGLREAGLWCPGDHTLVMTYNLEGPRTPDFKTLPLPARTGSEKMPPFLRPLFQKRPLDSGNLLWLAGNLETAEARRGLRTLVEQGVANLKPWIDVTAFVPGKDRSVLADIRTYRAGLRFGEKITLQGEFQASSGENAQKLETFLTGWGDLVGNLIPGFELTAQRDPGENWVVLQVKASPRLDAGKGPRPGQ